MGALLHMYGAIQYDTQEIVDIYLARPQEMSNLSLGEWFNNAHNLGNRNLSLCASSAETKHMILANGWNRLSLEPLFYYNRLFTHKGKKGN